MKVVAAKFDGQNLTQLLDQLAKDYTEPNVKVSFPIQAVDSDEDQLESVQKETHKISMIQQYSLHMASLIPTLFAHCLTSDHVKQCLQMLVKPAFADKDDQAKFKLFSTVLSLQKLKLGSKKGFTEDGQLWLGEINQMVYKVLKQSDATKSLAKHLKRILKYVKKEVSVLRAQLYQQVGAEKAPDRKIAFQTEAKRALAIEKLFLSLLLVTALPDDLE